MGKEPRIMSRSKLVDIDAGSLILEKIIESTGLAGTGGGGHVLEGADTKSVVSPNSCVKYVNILFETGLRDTAPAAPGFLEYAVVFRSELETTFTIPSSLTSGFGTLTVGDMCRNLYRGDCIWYGSFPVSREIPQVVPLKIKLPDKACKYKRGSSLWLILGHHGLNVADTTTDMRTFLTIGYKTYL